MTFTYDTAQLATSELFQVRLEIGDTAEASALLQDEEIDRAIAVEANFWGACARCCEIISRGFLRKADVRVGHGGTQLSYTTAAKQYADMAAALRKRSIAMNVPWAGGTSKDDKTAALSDTDEVQPIFAKGMQVNPRVGGQRSDTITDPSDDS